MQTHEFSGTLTALSSLSHGGGQQLGITQLFRREKRVQPDGSVEDVPIISGNSLRGILRDRGMWHMCRLLGYLPDSVAAQAGERVAAETDDDDPRAAREKRARVRVSEDEAAAITQSGLNLPAFYFLFSGGTLTSEGGSKSIDINYGRRLRELIPLVGVFGGAIGNTIMRGKLKVGKATPICRETAHLLPARLAAHAQTQHSVAEYLDREMYTRTDDERNEKLRQLIAPAPRALIEAAPSAKQTEAGMAADQHQQMRYYVETLAAGTVLDWYVVLEDVTDVEMEAMLMTLVEFSRVPFIGGKSGTGLGSVAINFDKWITIDSRVVETQGQQFGFRLGVLYAIHLERERAAIRAVLNGMV